MRTHLKLRLEAQPGGTGNVCVTLFAGQEGYTLQNTGTLIMSIGEWQLFGASLSLGASQGHIALNLRLDVEGEKDALDVAFREDRNRE